ncbi:alpha/beta hydrolase family protein [Actinosynnema pretiosum]|uniref:Alpha/beta hydrolase n=1 Tax=Actinosynnema pretiosum TaxID=42197 RepID=A0A290Z985_9PSEU|nr:alpha/beta hydrolase [Actinosynnema pretiosum]ATE55532.1 alpha/beta hydrolase [Actinosynnema pretiosum]
MRATIVLRRALLAALALALVIGLIVVLGNDYRFTQRAVSIPFGDGHLSGVLALPPGDAVGVVLVVHGDAAVDATHDGLYAPWFEGAADAGYATLSWSKPGVGGSTGDWLAQTMADRAVEVGAALDWDRAQPDVPTGRVVLWGASQAGWVLPKVVAARADVDAVVAVSPAVNWLRQGRHHLLSGLAGASPAERAAAVADSDRVRALLERGASYDEYRAAAPDPMSSERWGFVSRNFRADATADLRAAAERHVPVRLLLADHDRNVDVAETERAYREAFGADLTTSHHDAAHSMARPVVEDWEAVGLAVGVLWPRALLAPTVIPDYRDFLARL